MVNIGNSCTIDLGVTPIAMGCPHLTTIYLTECNRICMAAISVRWIEVRSGQRPAIAVTPRSIGMANHYLITREACRYYDVESMRDIFPSWHCDNVTDDEDENTSLVRINPSRKLHL